MARSPFICGKNRTDKHAMKEIVVCSTGQVGEINRSRLWGLATALFWIGGPLGCSAHTPVGECAMVGG